MSEIGGKYHSAFLKAQDHVARGVFVHNIKDIQLTVEDEERSLKIFTSKKLESEN